MKYTLQESRTILGIPKGASKEDIEKRYDVALKKHRQMKMGGTLNEESEAQFQKSTDAYRILMGYEVEEPKTEKKETYVDKAFVKAGIDRGKVGNFFHYYKYHILAGIVAVLIVVSIVYSVATKVKPDITIGLIGEVNDQATDIFKEKITKNIPEIKEVGFETSLISNRYTDSNSSAYLEKAMLLLSASDTDVFLVSKYVYDHYASDGPFMALDDVARELNLDVKSSDYLKLKVVDEWNQPTDPNEKRTPKTYSDSEPKLYGIDVTNSEFFKGVDVVGPEKILTVKARPKNRDLILKLIKLLSK